MMDFSHKNVLVVGVGISGNAVAKVAKMQGADKVVLSDAKAEQDLKYDLTDVRAAGVELVFGPQENTLLDNVDMVILSPAVPVRIPLVQEAYKREIPVVSEVQEAYELANLLFLLLPVLMAKLQLLPCWEN